MKILFTIIISIVLFSASVFSQAPQKMSYQSVLRNSSDQLVVNQSVGIKISILQGSTSGTSVYSETHSTTTNANGLISLEIGNGSTTDDFSAIDWSNGTYFIKTETDPAGGTNYTINGVSQILSVPYALHAKTANALTTPFVENQSISDVLTVNNNAGSGSIVNLDNITIGSSTINSDAALDVNSADKAFILPRLNTANRDLLNMTEGMLIYNTDLQKIQGVEPLSGDTTIDQQLLSSSSNGVTVNSSFTVNGQTFKAGINGYLVKLSIAIHSVNTAADFSLEIYEGEGYNGTLLSTTTVNISASGNQEFVLDNPPMLTDGQSYTFAVRYISSGEIAIIEDNSGTYTDGSSVTFGGTLAGCCDLVFTTYVTPVGLGWINLY